MPKFETQCKILKNTFEVVIKENPFAATLMLGNLFCSLKKSPKLPLLQKTLSDLKAKLTKAHIQLLFKTALEISSSRLKLMSQANLLSIELLKHQLVQDPDFFKHLPMNSLISLGQDMSFYREVLVALIRKHLDERNLPNPFTDPEFSYDLLATAAPEQNYQYFSPFIKRCPSVPLEKLVLLGEHHDEIARLILSDFKDTQVFFKVSNRFAYLHPTLRKEIADEWKAHVETLPLTTEEKAFTQEKLPTLKQEFPEFKTIDIENRVKRNNKVHPFVSKHKPWMDLLTKVNVAAAFTGFGIPVALSQVGLVMTIPPLAITLPVCYAVGFGINHILNKPVEAQRDLNKGSASPLRASSLKK